MLIKVLFVCLGNICRSPAAEATMNALIIKNHFSSKIQCDSAGTASYHIGNKADIRMRQLAKKRNITILSRARQLQADDLKNFDYILAMDNDNFKNIQLLDKNQSYSHKIYHYKDFCPSAPISGIPDPYYDDNDAFEKILDLLKEGSEELLKKIIKDYHDLE